MDAETERPETSAQDETLVIEADMALKQKLGAASFDQAVAPRLKTAEPVMAKSADALLEKVLLELRRLELATGRLAPGLPGATLLPTVIEAAFAIKSTAGFCGYSFASELARSLYLLCEHDGVRREPLSARTLDIIRAQTAGLKSVFAHKITGGGDKVCGEILGELSRLSNEMRE